MVAVWMEEEATLCPDCHTYEWEQPKDRLEPPKWVADIHVCWTCGDIEALKATVVKEHKPDATYGWKVRLYPDEEVKRHGD